MKKSILFASLLAGLLLASCGENNVSSDSSITSSQSSSQSSSTVETPTYEPIEYVTAVPETAALVASYDLSSITGSYDDGTLYFEEEDIKSTFVNTVTENNVELASAIRTPKGVERSQTAYGPKVGGIKLNCKYSGGITFNLVEGQTIDYAVFEIRSWISKGNPDTFKLSINGSEKVFEGHLTDTVKVIVSGEDLKSVSITSLGKDKTSRPTITGVKFYNK